MVIAIDGPAASGKGTLAKRLAAHYGLPHLDTGLLYRAVALILLDHGTPLSDSEAASAAASTLECCDLGDPRLRGRPMGEAASLVSSFPGVRSALLEMQRRFAAAPAGAVLDGRDIGTVVWPQASVKLFVTAGAEERARRRFDEFASRGERADYGAILEDIQARDRRDSTRAVAPLKAAPDARLLDTTALDPQGAFEAALAVIEEIQGAPRSTAPSSARA